MDQDTSVLTEVETVTVSGTDQAVSTDETSTEPDEAAKAAAEAAAAKAKAEAEAQAALNEQHITDFKALLGVRGEGDNANKWVSGALASDQRDTSTGVLPDGALNELRAKYNELPTGPVRTRIKQWVDAEISKAMEDADLVNDARTFYQFKKTVLVSVAGAKPAAPRVTVDPTDEWVKFMIGAYLAPYMSRVPAGVASDWSERVTAAITNEAAQLARTYSEYQDGLAELPVITEASTDEEKAAHAKALADLGDEPKVDESIKIGFRLIRGRPSGTSSTKKPRPAKSADGTAAPKTPRAPGTNKSTGAHIIEALASVGVGQLMSVSDIVNFKSVEYGDDKPSAGAVSARLHPGPGAGDGSKCTLLNIQGVYTADGKKAGVRTA